MAVTESIGLQKLLRDLDEQKQVYDQAIRRVQEYIASPIALRVDPPTSPLSLQRNLLAPTPFHGKPSLRKSTTLSTFESSSSSTGDEPDDEADQSLYVQDPLPQENYEDDGLRNHLQSYAWDEDDIQEH